MELQCREALELITAAADGRLEEEARVRLDGHLLRCIRCRNEFELETITKNFLRRTIQRTAPPAHLFSRIQEAAVNPLRTPVSQKGFWRRPPVILGFASAAAVVLLFFLVSPSRHLHTHPADGNVIHQTYNNFDAVLQGKMTPEIQTADIVAVKAFLTDRASFDVKVPDLRDCALLGGVSSQYVGHHLAHVVYRRGEDIIYLYETPMSCFRKKTALLLPEKALSELERTGWYVESDGPCSLALWVVDSTLCCAIADMDKDDLLACLKGNY